MREPITEQLNLRIKYEITTSLTALVIAGMSGVLYFETTESANEWYQRWSGIIANVIVNYFVTKETIDFLAQLIREKKYKSTAAASTVAMLSYLPQVIISWLEAPKEFDLGMKIFATSATALAGAALYGYAVTQLPSVAKDIVHTVRTEAPYYFRCVAGCVTAEETHARNTKTTVLDNLHALRERMRVTNYRGFDFGDNEEMLETAFRLVDGNNTPRSKFSTAGFCASTLLTTTQLLLQLLTAAILTYGSIGYTCDTERSLRQDFNMLPMIAVLLANVLMFFQYVLNVKGAFSLVSGITDNLAALKYGEYLTNDYRIGGKIGTAIFVAASPLAGVIASYSGFTSRALYEQGCASSQMKPITFRGGSSVVNYATVAFNGIYDVRAFCWMVRYYVKHIGSNAQNTEDKDYLKLMSRLDALIIALKRTDDVTLLLSEKVPGITEKLKLPHYFDAAATAEDDSIRRLLAASSSPA